MRAAVQEIRDNPENASKNRMGVLLGNRSFDRSTQTLTHVLWALFNVLPGHTVQVQSTTSHTIPCTSDTDRFSAVAHPAHHPYPRYCISSWLGTWRQYTIDESEHPRRADAAAAASQPPHRHNATALDLAIEAGPGVYTMMARGAPLF